MKIQTCKVANYIDVNELQHHPKNHELRNISDARMQDLKQSIIKKGLYEPLLVWTKDNTVLAGNQRLKAIKELIDEGYAFFTPGMKKLNQIPVVMEDVDDKRALEILHQANNHHGDWAQEKLAQAIKEAEEMGIEAADLGYTEQYIKRIMKEADDVAASLTKSTDYSEKNKEIDTGTFGEDLDHTCPRCGFSYDEVHK